MSYEQMHELISAGYKLSFRRLGKHVELIIDDPTPSTTRMSIVSKYGEDWDEEEPWDMYKMIEKAYQTIKISPRPQKQESADV